MPPSPPSGSILVVDDDPSVVHAVTLALEGAGMRAVGAAGPEEALARLAAEPYAAVVQDMNFAAGGATSGEEGLALLARIRAAHPRLPVLLLTAWGSIDLAVAGLKLGAADFLTKPWANERLLQALETALALEARRPEEAEGLDREELDRRHDLRGIVGRDPKLLRVLELVGRVAPTDASVLVLGESGTGKELVAEAIHRNSRRRGGPFVKVNLGGLSPTLFESEVFGHVRGAFTDARADRRGRFELADGGTIFLDEVAEVDPAAQVKLLRVLQDRRFEAVGSSVTRQVDVRVVSATNRDLAAAVAQRAFREDLLYRLNLITVRLPSLRERRGDVPLLARRFLAEARERFARDARLSPAALRWLEAQPWPGNVRQLRQTIERAVLVASGEEIDVGELRALADAGETAAAGGALPAPGAMTLDEMEEAMIRRALAHFDGNVTRAAEALGLSRPALYRRLEKHGLEPREP